MYTALARRCTRSVHLVNDRVHSTYNACTRAVHTAVFTVHGRVRAAYTAVIGSRTDHVRGLHCVVRQIESEKLFGNMAEVYKASCQFWSKHMSLVVRRSRETGEQLDCCLLKPGFLSVSCYR